MAPTREQVQSAVLHWAIRHSNDVRKNYKRADRMVLLDEFTEHLQTTLPDFNRADYPGQTILSLFRNGLREFRINASDKEEALFKGFPESVKLDQWNESLSYEENQNDGTRKEPKSKSKREAEDHVVEKPRSKLRQLSTDKSSDTNTRSRTTKSAARSHNKIVALSEVSEVSDSEVEGQVTVEGLTRHEDNNRKSKARGVSGQTRQRASQAGRRIRLAVSATDKSPHQTATTLPEDRAHATESASIDLEHSKPSQQQAPSIKLPRGTDLREIGYMETMKTFVTDTRLNRHTEPSEIREEMATLSPIIMDAISCGLKASGINGSKTTVLEPSAYCTDLRELLICVFGNLEIATHELADIQTVQRLRYETFLESLLAADLTKQVFEATPQGSPDFVDVRDRKWTKVIREKCDNAFSWLRDAVTRSIIEDEVLPKIEAKATALARRFMDVTIALFAAPAAQVMDLRVYGSMPPPSDSDPVFSWPENRTDFGNVLKQVYHTALAARAKWELDEAASYQFVFPRFKAPFSDETHEGINYWHAMGKNRQGQPERVFVSLLPAICAAYGQARDREWSEPVIISPAKVVILPGMVNHEVQIN